MKKLASVLGLSLSFFVSTHTQQVQATELLQPTNEELTTEYKEAADQLDALFENSEKFSTALVQEIADVRLCFVSLPLWAKARSVGLAAFGALAGNLTAYAIGNLFGEYRQPRVLHPSEWGFFVTTSTAAGLGAALYTAYSLEYPSGIAKKLDQALITLIIKNRNSESSDLVADLNKYFVLQQFPRMAAFTAIESLNKKLAKVNELLAHIKTLKAKDDFAQLSYKIDMTCEYAKNAMVTLKQDPRWLEECSAHAVTLAQQNMQAHQQGQLATSIIQFAHNR